LKFTIDHTSNNEQKILIVLVDLTQASSNSGYTRRASISMLLKSLHLQGLLRVVEAPHKFTSENPFFEVIIRSSFMERALVRLWTTYSYTNSHETLLYYAQKEYQLPL